MKPKLKPPGTKRLKLKHDVLLSTFAFKFNLRRYTLYQQLLAWMVHGLLAGAYTRPLLSSTLALEGLITQEPRRLTHSLSRANTLQGLTLVHFSAQPEPF